MKNIKGGKYKEQWDNYFDGKLAMWSYFGYKYHSYTITKHIVSKLPIPKTGKLIQLGTALGVVVEYLCLKYPIFVTSSKKTLSVLFFMSI